jgi:hypothetical protein
MLCGGLEIAYYNWRLTGNALQLPYMVNERQYALAPLFWIQPPPHPEKHVYRDRVMQEAWEEDAEVYQKARHNPVRVVYAFVRAVYGMFVSGPMSTLVVFSVMGVLVAAGNPRLRLALGGIVLFSVAVLVEKEIRPHYIAPAVSLLFLMTAAGLRLTRALRFRRRPVGRLIVVVGMAASILTFAVANLHRANDLDSHPLIARINAASQLNALPGRHVVFVHYSADHSHYAEFVYNGPDIDSQKIVWAFDRGPQADRSLRDYYPGRQFWLLNPDSPDPKLTRYPAE